MKKYMIMTFAAIILVLIIGMVFIGCSSKSGNSVNSLDSGYSGYDFFDWNYSFDRAIMRMPDGSTKELKIKSWSDAEDGEQLTITDDSGNRYLISSYNCVLIKDAK